MSREYQAAVGAALIVVIETHCPVATGSLYIVSF